jgi:hypothetical protein
VVPDPELDNRNCSLLSKHFQATYCLSQEQGTDFTDVDHRYTFPQNNKLDQPRFKAFDCGDLQFNKPNSDNVADKLTEAWRCLGNFNIMSGENWSIKGAASVRQDTTDISNSKHFGVCPEGDENCLGWGI